MNAYRLAVVADPPDPEAWLQQAADKVLACRAQGHAWPKLKPGGMRKGLRVARQHDGCYQITSICRDCGMERQLTTLPSGLIDHPAKYRYQQPDGYRTPKGAGVTRRDALSELWRRAREDAAAQAARQAAGA